MRKTDAEIRLGFMNAIIKPIDQYVAEAFNKVCADIAYDNDQLVDTIIPNVFVHKSEYYPKDVESKYRKIVLRKSASKLHTSLVEDFEQMYSLYVKEYNHFRAKFKTMLTELCRYATSADTFSLVLPDLLLRGTNNMPYVAIRVVKESFDSEAFKSKYGELLEKAVYYTSIRQLI